MAEEIQIEGKEYVSSRRAASLSGYAQDYIGQLARSGQIDARRVGGLWYILPESLNSYTQNADEYVPMPPAPDLRAANPESLVSFDGKGYVSSIRASKLTGYNQDYIGQLARSGKVLSRQIGNRWYVDRESLLNHKEEKDGLLGAVQAQSVGLAKSAPESSLEEAPSDDGLYFNYLADREALLPKLEEKIESKIPDLSDKHVLNLHNAKFVPTIPANQKNTTSLRSEASEMSGLRVVKPVLARHTKDHSSSVKKHALAGSLVVMIVLGTGFAAFKGGSGYFAFYKDIHQGPSIRSMNASAAEVLNQGSSIMDQVGSALEERFVPELQYQRQG